MSKRTKIKRAPAIVVDLDGTLLNLDGLRDWGNGKRTDYDEFHKLALEAPPNDLMVFETQDHFAQGRVVFIATARSRKYWNETAAWLGKHNVPYHKLLMRDPDDMRHDAEVKREMFIDILSEHEVLHAWDDHPDVLAVWKELGVPVTEVPGWEA